MIYYQTYLDWECFKHGEYGLKSNDIIVSYTDNISIMCERILYWSSYENYVLRNITYEFIDWLKQNNISYPFTNKDDELLFRLTFE